MHQLADDHKNVVVLTRNGPEHRYVANRLCREFDIKAVIVDRHRQKPNHRKAWKRGVSHFVSKALRGVLLSVIHDNTEREHALNAVLGGLSSSDFIRPERVIPVENINSQSAMDEIRRHNPSVIMVYGTGIVSDKILGMASDLALNMHTGISPFYRGAHCAFWPIVNKEMHMLGATVHECTSKVDGGQIFATRRAVIEKDDGLHDIFAKCVAVGSDLYVDALRAYLSGALKGEPQDIHDGREYRGYMRTLWPEIKARWLIRRGLVR